MKSKEPAVNQPAKSDNVCKLLAEMAPKELAEWVFGQPLGEVRIDNTELSREPIRADSVFLLDEANEILQIEFQTTAKSNPPIPLRMLDYKAGLKRRNYTKRVRQSVVVLSDTGQPVPDRYEDEDTVHRYRVIKMWEQDPDELLKREGLIPLATLCRTRSGIGLLKSVATRLGKIEPPERRRDQTNLSQLLAGLLYNHIDVYRLLRESEMLEESSVYQDILRKGERKGRQEGIQEVVFRQLNLVLGKISTRTRHQIEKLDVDDLKILSEALITFKTERDLTNWLKENASAR